MKIIIPFLVTDASLVSTTVSATDPLAASSRGVWSAANSYAIGDIVQVDSPTITFTASGVLITSAAHCFPIGTIFQLSTTGTLPAGLSAGVNYYLVQPTINSFKLSILPNGAPVITTSAGTGTHTATASTHKLYECMIPVTPAGVDPRKLTVDWLPTSTAATWLYLTDTNRWKAFDGSCTSMSEGADSVQYVIQTKGRCNAVALLNINAVSVTIVAKSAGAIVYSSTVQRSGRTGVLNGWYSFFFTPLTQKSNVAAFDLPSYGDMEITITLTATGGTAQVGAIIIGASRVIGKSIWGTSVGTIDYSAKVTDNFGNKTVVQRAYSDRASYVLEIASSETDGFKRMLTNYRATPIVYSGSELFDSTLVYGYYKDLNIVLSDQNKSTCTVEVEGLA
jgi:hypothetical protein